MKKSTHSYTKPYDFKKQIGNAISLETLFDKFDYVTFAGVTTLQRTEISECYRLGFTKGAFDEFKSEYNALTYQFGKDISIKTFITNVHDISETQAKTLWVITNTTESVKFPEMPTDLLLEIYLKRLMSGLMVSIDSNVFEISGIKNGNVACMRSVLECELSRMCSNKTNKRYFTDEEIKNKIDYLTTNQNFKDPNYIALTSSYHSELKLVELLNSYNAPLDSKIKFNKRPVFDIQKFNPTEKQKIAINKNSQLNCVFGAPGTGKTACAGEIAYRLIGDTERAIVIAPTHAAKDRLNQKTNITKILHQVQDGSVSTIDSMYYKLRSKKTENESFFGCVLIVDEISMIGNQFYYKLEYIIKRVKPISIILLGDDNQLPPVLQIGSLPALIRNIDNYVVLDECKRTNSIDLIKYYTELMNTKSLDNQFNGDFVVKTYTVQESRKMATTLFIENSVKPFDSIIATYKKENVRIANAITICKLLKKGIIKNDIEDIDELFKSLISTDKDIAIDARAQVLLNGVQVIITTNKFLECKNGEYGIIKSSRRDTYGQYKITIEMSTTNKTIEIAVGEKDLINHIDLFYASTVHKLQGTEFDNVYFIGSESTNYFDNVALAYTACSRSKGYLKVFTSGEIKLAPRHDIKVLNYYLR
jgi:ATP-dependent exoDNAse (exonuclease V) alpha subunit